MSTVIKAGQRISTPGVVAYNLDDVARQGQSYLDEVKAHAARIIAEAQGKAVAIAKAAEEQGRQAAQSAALRQLDSKIADQLQPVLPALREAIAGIQRAREECVRHWEGQAIHVAAAIASRVIRREVEREPKITLSLVREALEMASGSPHVRLRMNPGDRAALAGQVESLLAELARVGTSEIVEDPAITPGGCKVETRFGAIDQRIESQLRRIEEELR